MAADWVGLIPLAPIAAAATVATGLVSGHIGGEKDERLTAGIVLGGTALSLVLAATAAWLRADDRLPDQILSGTWLESGAYRIGLGFQPDRTGLSMTLLVAVLALLTQRFAVNYMHREPGYHRFFLVLSLFAGAMLLLALAGNVALAFVGWELAGVCSYLLIAYAYDRPNAAANATRAFVTNRIGDAGFLVGIFLSFGWAGGLEWERIGSVAPLLGTVKSTVLATAFLTAALAKSAQVPFTPWLARAIEGPTPSSAVFYGALLVHAGAFLVLRLEPVFGANPLAMHLLLATGLLSAGYGWLCGLAQSDVKSALIFATVAQVGLIFAEVGLGWWDLALWHLLAHSSLRAYQFLAAPGLMHQIRGIPTPPPHRWLARSRFLYLATLQRLWLESLIDWLAVKPVQQISRDAQILEAVVVVPAFGSPTDGGAAERNGAAAISASGLAGRLIARLAETLQWFEDKLLLRGAGDRLVRSGRRLGNRLNHLERLLNRPRYTVLLILITLLQVL